MVEYFSYIKTVLCSCSISLLFFVNISIYIFSGGINRSAFVTFDAPISKSALIGLVPGILHGLVMGLFLIWRKSDSITSTLTASILAMELILISICMYVWMWNRLYASNNPDTGYLYFAFYFIKFFLGVSILLIVPAILIGLLNKLLLF